MLDFQNACGFWLKERENGFLFQAFEYKMLIIMVVARLSMLMNMEGIVNNMIMYFCNGFFMKQTI